MTYPPQQPEASDELPTDLKTFDAARAVTPRAPWPWPTPAPGTNGSQFFLVYGDTPLAPNYSVFGTYNGPGQATIDKIAAGGIAPSPDIPGGEDGAPKTPVTIQQAATEG